MIISLDQIIEIAWLLAKILMIVVPLLLSMAYLTYAERKIIAAINLRQGPVKVGPLGLLQPIADAIKLLGKETIIPSEASKFLFIASPMITYMFSLAAWAVIPFDSGKMLADINIGILYVYAISSLGVYGILLSGWASNSRYAFLGSIRASAQMISYEVSIGLVIVSVLLTTGTLNLSEIVTNNRPWWVTILLFPMFVIFFVSALAETNRCPFDLPEGESELVGGYNVEYSSMTFALFFLGEYLNMILMSAMTVILFMGGWLPPLGITALAFMPGIFWFIIKVCFVLFMFIWVRATMPRYRYDQLMRLGWKVFLPFTLFWLIVIAAALLFTGSLPGVVNA
jgi:NADH-quinone oxidoreductase subunit H